MLCIRRHTGSCSSFCIEPIPTHTYFNRFLLLSPPALNAIVCCGICSSWFFFDCICICEGPCRTVDFKGSFKDLPSIMLISVALWMPFRFWLSDYCQFLGFVFDSDPSHSLSDWTLDRASLTVFLLHVHRSTIRRLGLGHMTKNQKFGAFARTSFAVRDA